MTECVRMCLDEWVGLWVDYMVWQCASRCVNRVMHSSAVHVNMAAFNSRMDATLHAVCTYTSPSRSATSVLIRVFVFHLLHALYSILFHSLAFQFFIAVSNYTGAGKEDKLKFAFMIFDEEGNGVITKAELLKILKANHMASHDSEVARKADTIMVRTIQCCIGQCSIVTTRCPHE